MQYELQGTLPRLDKLVFKALKHRLRKKNNHNR